MELSCKHVWEYISDYIDGSVDGQLRAHIEHHLENCEICSAILDSTRNILYLTADDRTFALPVGFSERLRLRLEAEIAESRIAEALSHPPRGNDEERDGSSTPQGAEST